jgi:ABC-type transport system involved in cytochrome c biogenesis permease subunit
MTKAVFQIGMLAFCVATVYFGLERSDIIEILGKSFIIFTAVVCGGIVVLLVVSGFVGRKQEEEHLAALAAEERAQGKTAAEPAK